VVAETDGPEVIVAVLDGAVVSIVQETIAAAPRLPATSRRRTANVCEPSASEAVVVGEDAEEQLRRAHLHLQVYSGLPNYRNSWIRQGFDESDFIPGGSDRLARGIAHDDKSAIQHRGRTGRLQPFPERQQPVRLGLDPEFRRHAGECRPRFAELLPTRLSRIAQGGSQPITQIIQP
jgi:hypothetical protein